MDFVEACAEATRVFFRSIAAECSFTITSMGEASDPVGSTVATLSTDFFCGETQVVGRIILTRSWYHDDGGLVKITWEEIMGINPE